MAGSLIFFFMEGFFHLDFEPIDFEAEVLDGGACECMNDICWN